MKEGLSTQFFDEMPRGHGAGEFYIISLHYSINFGSSQIFINVRAIRAS